MDPLRNIDRSDLEQLLALEPELALGRIVELNGRDRYHNTLNVIEVLVRLRELREAYRIGHGSNIIRRVA